MTKRIRTLIGLILLTLGSAGCGDRSLAVAPSRPPLTPAGPSEPRLIIFTEQGTGFSTADLYDAEDDILQIDTHAQLVWVADGTRLQGYHVDGHAIDGIPVYWISGRICSPDCAFEVRFGAKDGQRRAYLTVDYGHDNPGTLVDVEVVQGQLVVTPTGTYPPGSPTMSGVIYEQAAGGQVAVEGATVAVSVSSGWRYTVTDTKGYYEVRGLFDGAKSVHVAKDGYGTAVGSAAIKGDTRFDVELVRR